MTMTLKELAADDLDVAYDTGLPWVMTVTIDGTQMPAIVTHAADPDAGDGYTRAEAKVRVRRSDLVDQPEVDDEITIDGEVWRVVRVERYSEREWAVFVISDRRLTFAR